MNVLLEATELSKHFGGLKAVDDLSLEIHEGELHCLIGPNGAGKSTFFRLILGRFRPTSGTVRFHGEDITHLQAAARIHRGMSVKLQVPGIFPQLPARQNLIIALQHRFRGRELTREMDRLLALVDLDRDAEKRADQLAHGQKQWLEIAMAISTRPSLLLLDEPTAGMSAEETYKTGEMIMELNRKGVTVLVVEHDMAFVRQIARRVSVLHLGRLFAQGSIDEITANEGVQEIYLGKVRHGH
jgi:branched-chain amino acid transport system ATP-binding protein